MIVPQQHMRASARKAAKPQGEIRKIETQDLPALSARLAKSTSADPYLLSAAYHGLTGRNGLWMYAEDEDFVLFCLHPNAPGKFMIFPAVGGGNEALTRNLLQSSVFAGREIQLARIPLSTAEEMATHLSWTTGGYGFEACDEQVLDWLYPVHTLSTDMVCAHAGGAFKDFRKNTHRVDTARVSVESLDLRAHYFDLLSLSLTWAREHASARYSVDDLLSPYTGMFRMMRESELDLRGSVVFMDGRCVSFAVWEMPAGEGLPAVSIASLSHGPCKGLSELQYLEMCRALKKCGVARVCIGGSETASLDAYKRKMNPVASAALKSARVAHRAAVQEMKGLPMKTSLSAPSNTSWE